MMESNSLNPDEETKNHSIANLASAQKPKMQIDNGEIAVVCRFRPLSEKEKDMEDINICPKFKSSKTVQIPITDDTKDEEKSEVLQFSFDRVFDMNADLNDIYEVAALPIIQGIFEGLNGTIFAYDQTSSEKTNTNHGIDLSDETSKGIIPLIVSYIFERIEKTSESISFTTKVSMMEIHMEKVWDMLDPENTDLHVHQHKEKGICIGDVTEAADVYEIIRVGNEHRSKGITNMNKQSKRSHLWFTITITQYNSANRTHKTGKLCLVDLAGSENKANAKASDIILGKANKKQDSLNTLEFVVNNLIGGNSKNTANNGCKLTKVLQDTLGENSKASLIITCSPSSDDAAETVSTLRFGQKVLSIQNKPLVERKMSASELDSPLKSTQFDINSTENHVNPLMQTMKRPKVKRLNLASKNDSLKEETDSSIWNSTTSKSAADLANVEENKTSESDNKDIDDQNSPFKYEYEQVASKNEVLTNMVTELKVQNEELKASIDSKVSKLADHKTQAIVDKFNKQNEENQMLLKLKEKVVQDLENKYSNTKLELSKSKKKISTERKKFKEEKDQLEKSMVDERDKETGLLESEIKSWKNKYTDLEKHTKATEENKNKKLGDELSRSRNQANEYKNELDKLYTELDKYKDKKKKKENGFTKLFKKVGKAFKTKSAKTARGVERSKPDGNDKNNQRMYSFMELM